jgi:L-aminopeptidase/D-esterase-like protein/N-acetylglutamate synthase-like GNAT family acetyltransferase
VTRVAHAGQSFVLGVNMAQPRYRDAVTDVPGIRTGHWTDRKAATGCTVILCPAEGAVAACVVLGGSPGTRETDVLSPGNAVQRIHALLLTGGSAFGLDAATGVMRWLDERGIGFETRSGRVPIVPAAVIYDLATGRGDVRPDANAGYAACEAAGTNVRQGSVGGGTGATVAKLGGPERIVKGGLGTASEHLAGGGVVGALVVVNAVGEIVDPLTGKVVAGVRPAAGSVTDGLKLLRTRRSEPPPAPENTTIAVIATDIRLTRDQLYRVALMAHGGIARAVRPSHTPGDGDTVFALSTGERVDERVDLTAIGALGARALERAILNAVRHATPVAGVPAARRAPSVRPVSDADRPWIAEFTAQAWGAETVASKGVLHRPAQLDGFVTEEGGQITGLVTVFAEGRSCEVVTLNSIVQGAGNGSALMAAAERYASERGCNRLWLMTTNDNTHAVRFYQRLGMRITAIHPGAIDAERAIKPEIPLTGNDGIPIRDEIVLEKLLGE